MKRSLPSGRSFTRQLLILFVIPALWLGAVGAHASSDGGAESSLFTVLIFIAGLVAVSVLIITALTRWGHRQDSIGNMMTFCIKYLVETRNEAQKCEAAQALGEVKDPGALLILVDVINDESAEENLRKTAGDALRNLSGVYSRYEQVIDDLLSAQERKDHRKSIDILISNFENRNKKYVQSAYVIGREFMRLKEYAEAREWLQRAKSRNEKSVVYVNQISERIRLCNEKLFSHGDVLFKVGDYYDALERYALASHDLSPEEKQRFASHLRLAAVYCKLKRYDDAYQETLHALHDHHETDYSLRLNGLLKKQRGEIGGTPEAEQRRKKILEEVDNYVTTIMSELASRKPES
jgi:tetratricopeptide (TPR) repeat protein